jgi:AraC-like DNA-binding protein
MKTKPTRVFRRLAGFDVMTDVLGVLGLRSRLLARTEFARPWIMPIPASEETHFHIVERGRVWLQLEAKKSPLPLSAGDLAVITRRQAYSLFDSPRHRNPSMVEMPRGDASGRCAFVRAGSGAPTSGLICGGFVFAHADHPLLAMLPKFMTLRGGKLGGETLLQGIVEPLIAEVSEMRPGSETVISRLMDVLFIQVLRTWLSEQPSRPSWLAALNDSRIGPMLASIHERPEHTWTVEQLAAKVGLSRSRFSVLFSRVVGESPQSYLTRLRMQRASSLLREHQGSIADVALATGYESESSFSKAFRRQYGKTPGRYRRDSVG